MEYKVQIFHNNQKSDSGCYRSSGPSRTTLEVIGGDRMVIRSKRLVCKMVMQEFSSNFPLKTTCHPPVVFGGWLVKVNFACAWLSTALACAVPLYQMVCFVTSCCLKADLLGTLFVLLGN